MSKNEQTQGTPKDAFSVYQQNVDKFFTSIKQSVPQYHQSKIVGFIEWMDVDILLMFKIPKNLQRLLLTF